tara:strand:- start:151 stop:333 length:183 start_codon:yes stop_codon:yes gene_type:complete
MCTTISSSKSSSKMMYSNYMNLKECFKFKNIKRCCESLAPGIIGGIIGGIIVALIICYIK